jgi:hypothetical protein
MGRNSVKIPVSGKCAALALLPHTMVKHSTTLHERKFLCEYTSCALNVVAEVLFIEVVDTGETTGAPPPLPLEATCTLANPGVNRC